MPLPKLHDGDLHAVFDDTRNMLKLFKVQGESGVLLFSCEARNDTVRKGRGRWTPCPRGDYLIGAPTDTRSPPFGEHFTPLFDLGPDGPMHKEGRIGVGIHAGGSGLPDPFADRQGWVPTHGCLRLQGEDNNLLVKLVRQCQREGHRAYLTVTGEPS